MTTNETAASSARTEAAQENSDSSIIADVASTVKRTDAIVMRRIRRGLWVLGPDEPERPAPNVKWPPPDEPEVDVCVEADAICRQRNRGLWCDACNRAVTVEDGVAEFDDEYGAFIVHERCSNDALALLNVDLATLRREPDRMFDPVYPALREVALRLDRVRWAFVATRPFPFNCFAAFTMPPEPDATVTA